MKVNVGGRVEQLERKERKKGGGWKTGGRWKNWEREAGREEGKTERGEQKERKERLLKLSPATSVGFHLENPFPSKPPPHKPRCRPEIQYRFHGIERHQPGYSTSILYQSILRES
ncbi:hypothetical protein Pcinc_015966 [Petrolisthes cinctipes]|uniref:Uncharacterized protein n=1 Tax=Petrolisthes cinctipes TaxID=88211 RepID=A0AAE1KP75_PETCI|nr:hypothetical protein Pcinc_015966 [Petrolisthes cinctipes]